MPNWCYNTLEVVGSPENRLQFHKDMQQHTPKNLEGSDFSLGFLCPIPQDSQSNWCVNNWGTKWDAKETIIEQDSTYLVYSFSTAWDPPLPVIHRWAGAYPNLQFKLEYTCEEDFEKTYNVIGDPKKISEERDSNLDRFQNTWDGDNT